MSNICQFSCTIAQNLSHGECGVFAYVCVCAGVCGVWSSTATLAKSRRAATSLPRRHTPQSRTHISVTLTRMHNTRKHTHTHMCRHSSCRRKQLTFEHRRPHRRRRRRRLPQPRDDDNVHVNVAGASVYCPCCRCCCGCWLADWLPDCLSRS